MPPKRKRSPEEEKRLKEGQEFIGEREKRISQLAGGKEVTKIMGEQATADVETGIKATQEKERLEIEAAEQEKELLERQKELLPVAEETGVFEPRPERVELDVTEEEKLAKPGILRKIVFGDPIKEVGKTIFGAENAYKINDLIQDPETMRAKMLQEIQREELKKSSTASQKLGALLEPVVGDLKVFDVDIGRYVDKFLRMPKQEVEEIVMQMKELESSVSGMTDAASQGEIGNPSEVLRDIAEKETQAYRLEARLKRLILESDELKANPEKVNIIEEQILKTKETIFEARQRAAEGALITPTDSHLYLTLQELKGG